MDKGFKFQRRLARRDKAKRQILAMLDSPVDFREVRAPREDSAPREFV